jgi:hypothetical protein
LGKDVIPDEEKRAITDDLINFFDDMNKMDTALVNESITNQTENQENKSIFSNS